MTDRGTRENRNMLNGIAEMMRRVRPGPVLRVKVPDWLYKLLIAAGARPAPAPRKRPGPVPRDIGLDDFLDWLDSFPYLDLLEFRTHAAFPHLAKKLQCGCVGTITFLYDVALRQVEAAQVELMGSPVPTPGHDDLLQAVTRLRNRLDNAREFNRSIEVELRELRELTGHAVSLLADQPVRHDVRERLLSLRNSLDRLERILNDFSGADLSGIDLSGMRLEGVRWSRDTKWPRGWRERIAENSKKGDAGISVIRADDSALLGPQEEA